MKNGHGLQKGHQMARFRHYDTRSVIRSLIMQTNLCTFNQSLAPALGAAAKHLKWVGTPEDT